MTPFTKKEISLISEIVGMLANAAQLMETAKENGDDYNVDGALDLAGQVIGAVRQAWLGRKEKEK